MSISLRFFSSLPLEGIALDFLYGKERKLEELRLEKTHELREVVAAYSSFANHGVYTKQHLITRVESADGEILYQVRIEQREALPPADAYMMTNLLETTLKEGTGISARWRGFTKTGAGKTGTTDLYTDAWFVGFTPDMVGGVWVGFDQVRTMGHRKTGAVMRVSAWTTATTSPTAAATPARMYSIPSASV